LKTIELTRGLVALVDDADYPALSRFKWYADKHGRTFYACRRGDGKTLLMHRVLLGLDFGDSKEADHVDGDGLNNQRSNLRAASSKENSRNCRKRQNKTSVFKGVRSYPRDSSRWLAQIRVDGKKKYLGLFDTETDAARAYDAAAKEAFGEFARLNFSPLNGEGTTTQTTDTVS
jgi:hypothetical protein